MTIKDKPNRAEPNRKKALYLSDNVFSTKVLTGDTIFTSPTGDGNAILRAWSSEPREGRGDARKTHPRDGSLSVGNPTRA